MSLPEIKADFDNIQKYQKVSKEWMEQRKAIVKKLRDLADRLEKIHGDVLIADRVGTGVGMGGGILTIGGLIAAPFTAGISLGLSVVGTGASFLGGLTSLGSNITDVIWNKISLSKIREELQQHQISSNCLSDLIPDISNSLARLAKFRPTLERLAQFSEENLQTLMESALRIVPELLKGNSNSLYKMFENVDPSVSRFLNGLSVNSLIANGTLAVELTKILSFVKENIKSIKCGLNAYVIFRNEPNLAKLAMDLTRITSTGQKAPALVKDVATVRAVFRETPLGLSARARGVAGVASALFLAADVYYMTRICQDTKETPTVITLRDMADSLEQNCLESILDRD